MSGLPKRKFSTYFPCYQAVEEGKTAENPKNPTNDPRVNDLGRAIEDDYATIRTKYGIFSSTTQNKSAKSN